MTQRAAQRHRDLTLVPYDDAAEKAALGACLHGGAAATLVVESLGSADMFVATNRQALKAVEALVERGASVDPFALAAELEKRGMSNPRPFVFGLHHDSPGTLSSVREAVAIIHDRTRRRHALRIASEIERVGANGANLDQLAKLGEELGAIASGATGNNADRAHVVRLSEVMLERVAWLWQDRIPRGKLTVLDGDPGLGKSTVMLDLAARVSSGSPMPDGERPGGPSGVLLLTAEDGIADTIRPRLDTARGDPTRVVVLSSVTDDDGTPRPPEIPADLETLERRALEESAALVVVDPLMAFLGSKVDSWRDQDVRRALHALGATAERTGAAIIVVRHLTKSGGAHALYRGGGSIGIIGAARSGLLVAPDPSDEHRRVLAMTKANLAPMAAALAYRLVGDELTGAARIVWEGPTQHTAADLLSVRSDDRAGSAREEADEWLRDLLAAGPVASRDVKDEARDAGLSWATVRRAQEALGIRPRKVGAPGSGRQFWAWALPEDAHATLKMLTPEQKASSTSDEQLRERTSQSSIRSRDTPVEVTGKVGGQVIEP